MLLDFNNDVQEKCKFFNDRIQELGARYGFKYERMLDESYSYCYSFYYGCGHHVYFFVDSIDVERLEVIVGNGRRLIEAMANDLHAIESNARLVRFDAEMGGLTIL